MLSFSRKKAQSVAPLPISKPGFFSTDGDAPDTSTGKHERVRVSMAASIQRKIEDLKPVTHGGTAMDDMSNMQVVKLQNAGLIGAVNDVQFNWYASQGFIGYQVAAIISQNWLVDKCCSMPAGDAVRHWYDLSINDGSKVSPALLKQIKKLDKQFRLKKNAYEFVKKGRIFGMRVALFEVESPDPLYYEKPFNIDGVRPGSYKGISQVDPYWTSPVLDQAAAVNPAAIHFYEPTWWQINGKRYHRSHLIIYRNGDVPDILKPTYFYGGIPVPQRVMERVYAAERTANEAPLLAMTKRTNAVHVDITKAMADLKKFTARMEQWAYFQNNFGVKVLGKDEVMEQFDTALSDLDEVIMTQFQLVASAADVPATKLLGTSPKGFNATGDYEEKSYHEFLESIQENDLTPLVDRHYELLIRSEMPGNKTLEIEPAWNAVDSPSAEQQANINKTKADTDAALVGTGAVDGFDVRQRLIKDKDSGYNGIPDVVDGGPGDREAEQERQDAELDGKKDG